MVRWTFVKVHKNTLGRFRTQINLVLCVFRDALEGFEHQVKLTDIGKILAAAFGAGDTMFLDKCLHLLKLPMPSGRFPPA